MTYTLKTSSQEARGDKFKIEISRGRKLRSALKKAGGDLADLKTEHGRAARIAASRAESYAPVRTGALVATIRSSGTTTGGVLRAGRKRVPYAGPLEWGWPSHHIEEQAFMRRAAHDTEPQWVGFIQDAIDRALTTIITTS